MRKYILLSLMLIYSLCAADINLQQQLQEAEQAWQQEVNNYKEFVSKSLNEHINKEEIIQDTISKSSQYGDTVQEQLNSYQEKFKNTLGEHEYLKEFSYTYDDESQIINISNTVGFTYIDDAMQYLDEILQTGTYSQKKLQEYIDKNIPLSKYKGNSNDGGISKSQNKQTLQVKVTGTCACVGAIQQGFQEMLSYIVGDNMSPIRENLANYIEVLKENNAQLEKEIIALEKRVTSKDSSNIFIAELIHRAKTIKKHSIEGD